MLPGRFPDPWRPMKHICHMCKPGAEVVDDFVCVMHHDEYVRLMAKKARQDIVEFNRTHTTWEGIFSLINGTPHMTIGRKY